MNIAQQRLQTQHLINTPFSSPEEVVQWFGAVQAQEYWPSLWAVGLRLAPGVTEKTVQQAVLDRKIVRTWPMRGTIHYVPAEDAAWMTKLTARRVNKKLAKTYAKHGATSELLAIAGESFAKSLQGGKQLTRKELYADLEQAGFKNANKIGLFAVTYWAQEGLICFGPHQEKQPTFVLLDEWVPKQRQLEGDEALAELARSYFRSHGPATVQDFAWWSGLTASEAKHALDLVATSLVSEDVDGRTYWFTAGTQVSPKPSLLLLPCFDEYTVAYKDRSAAVPAERLKELGYGVSNNNIIADGQIIGSWKRTLKKTTVELSYNLLRELSPTEQAELASRAQQYANFIGYTLTTTTK